MEDFQEGIAPLRHWYIQDTKTLTEHFLKEFYQATY